MNKADLPRQARDNYKGKLTKRMDGVSRAKGLPGAVHFTIQLAPGGLANSGDLGIHSNALFAGDKAVLFSHSYYLKTIILPSQARDKCRRD